MFGSCPATLGSGDWILQDVGADDFSQAKKALFVDSLSLVGICQKKLHIGFSKYSKFKRVILLVLMIFCVCVQ